MAILEDVVVPHNSGRSFIVKKGQRIRVIGETTCDFVVFNPDNLYERFDQARTKANQVKVYITTGDVLYSKINSVMMTIVEDTYKGRHDLQYGMCSRFARDEWWRRRDEPQIQAYLKVWGITKREDMPMHGCYENIMTALQNYPILPVDIPAPLNLFQHMEIAPDGRMIDRRHRDRPGPGKPAQVDFRAEMDCLVALSACPESNGKGKPLRVQVFDK